MDIKKEDKKLREFWNNYFVKIKAEKITSSDAKIESKLDEFLKLVGDNCNNVLDIGTGTGYCAFKTAIMGNKVKKVIAIDPSENAINFINETCKISDIKKIQALIGDQEALKKFGNDAFDGIICSNVLDVVPNEITQEIISQIDRIMKSDGYLLLKFNFYLTDELIKKINMEKIDENTYAINGVLRGVNYTTEEWIKRFNNYKVENISEYERIPNGPKDRIVLLKKL